MSTIIKVGDTVPEGTFTYVPYTPELDNPLVCGVASKLSTNDWKGKKVLVVAVPGAFTPTCHIKHLPGFIEQYDEFKMRRIDQIVVLSANDHWVLSAWGRAEGAQDKLIFASDAYAQWSSKLGLSVDLTANGMGIRTGRYAMVLDDLKVTLIDVEPIAGAVTVSGAEQVLSRL